VVGAPDGVILCGGLAPAGARDLTRRYDVELIELPDGADIPGSFWGEPEAGLIGSRLHVRCDTPAHSLLHELSHYVCMPPERRAALNTDAGGDDDEECAVCYLQVVLADCLPGFGRARCLADMQRWGYCFRQGSARSWFDGDGRDARRWLETHRLIDSAARPTWRKRVATIEQRAGDAIQS
jgi:hypothetical protein